jgi:hypothetical protein
MQELHMRCGIRRDSDFTLQQIARCRSWSPTCFTSVKEFMRRKKIPILLIAFSAVLAAQTDPSGRVGRLSYISGPVSLQPAGVTEWVDADVNRPLTTGDQVWVGDGGRAEIHVGSTALRLDSNTAFQFLNLDDQTIQIQLSQGNLTVRARNLAQNQNLELDTPSLAFTVLRPGEYRIGANPDSQTTTVTVRDGDGEVTGGGQTFPVHGRQQAIVVGGDQITYNLVSAPGTDGWDQWNYSRDRREDGSPSARYVSREVGGYEELDQYGSWGNQPGYGPVWMPTTVAAGWAPYHDGHWAWIAPWGWTWVDEAPWGFAPSHYGRWASFGNRWGWVPGPYGEDPLYAPALVGWVGGGRGGSGFSLSFSFGNAAAVGWFPLGPREPYFPSYGVSSRYFGRVNNSNTVINNTTINNYYNESRNSNNTTINNIKYANRNVQNAVTAVPQERFANGRRVGESARAVSGAQLTNARFSAAPAIAPQRASVLGPRAEQASRAPRPPAAVLSRPVVARTAPPPAPVAFERQQADLNRNPGRPLPLATVQQISRSAPARITPVRVVDMSRIQRIQPAVGTGPHQGAPQANSAPHLPGVANSPPVTAQPRSSPAQMPAANNKSTQPPSNAATRPNGRWSNPVARPDGPPPNGNPRQQNTPPTNAARQPGAPPPSGVNNRPGEAPTNAAGRKNGRWSTPVARPNAPQPSNTPRQQNAPPPKVMQQPSVPPPNAVRQPSVPPPNAVRQPSVPPPNAARQPSVPPPNAARQPSVPPPNAARQPSVPPPNAARPPSVPPPNRQQLDQRDRVAPPAQPSRPQAQAPQRQPPPQIRQAPAARPAPASPPNEAKGRPEKKDEKK